MHYKIRKMRKEEYPMLKTFLYEAVYIPDGVSPPPKSIVELPELKIYIEGFGDKEDDIAFVAEADRKVVGAVWVRIMDDYGHIDNKTPSFAISLYNEYRGIGIGTNLMERMISYLKCNGYKKCSLSVQKKNFAFDLYKKLGFKVADETDEEYIMVKYL